MRKSLFTAALVLGGLLASAGNASACWGWGCCGYGWGGYGYYGYYGPYWGWGAAYYAPYYSGYAYYPSYYPAYYPSYWGWGGFYSPWGYGWGWYGQANQGGAASIVGLPTSKPVTEGATESRPEAFVRFRPVTEGQEEARVLPLANYPKPVSEATETHNVSASFTAYPER
jgi:hypothetical protein